MSWRDVWEPSAPPPSIAARKVGVPEEPMEEGPVPLPPAEPTETDVRWVVEQMRQEHALQMQRLTLVLLVAVILAVTYVDGLRRDVRRMAEPRPPL